MSNRPKIQCGMTDSESIEYCKDSNKSKMYNKADIVDLATRCGIEDASKKNRADLCELIAKKVSSRAHLEPDCRAKSENCMNYNKSEIEQLAEKCGVSTQGTRADMCSRIAKSILSLPPSKLKERDLFGSDTSSAGTPSYSGTPQKTQSDSKCILDHPTVAKLESTYTRSELIRMCNEKGMECKSGWTKTDLAKAIIACSGPTPQNPQCLENMHNLPSVDDLMSYNREDLVDMCAIKGIKHSKSSTKLQLAQALYSCACTDGTPISPSPSPTLSPPLTPPLTPPQTYKTSGDVDDCVSKLQSKNVGQIQALFEELNLMGRPTTKADMSEYICANKKCRAPNWDCEGDLVCDISSRDFPNGEGVCIPKKLADSRKKHKSYILPSGTRVIGMPSVIDKLAKEINDRKSSSSSSSSSSIHSRPSTVFPTFSSVPPVLHKPQTGASKYNIPCYANLTYEELNKMTKADLIGMFFGTTGSKINISVNSWTKGEIIAYLCAKGQNNYCTSPDWECEENYVCDANTNPGICVRPDFADEQLKRLTKGKPKYSSMVFDGKKIIGKPEIIKKLTAQLSNSSSRSPSPPPRQASTPPRQASPPPYSHHPSTYQQPTPRIYHPSPPRQASPPPYSHSYHPPPPYSNHPSTYQQPTYPYTSYQQSTPPPYSYPPSTYKQPTPHSYSSHPSPTRHTTAGYPVHNVGERLTKFGDIVGKHRDLAAYLDSGRAAPSPSPALASVSDVPILGRRQSDSGREAPSPALASASDVPILGRRQSDSGREAAALAAERTRPSALLSRPTPLAAIPADLKAAAVLQKELQPLSPQSVDLTGPPDTPDLISHLSAPNLDLRRHSVDSPNPLAPSARAPPRAPRAPAARAPPSARAPSPEKPVTVSVLTKKSSGTPPVLVTNPTTPDYTPPETPQIKHPDDSTPILTGEEGGKKKKPKVSPRIDLNEVPDVLKEIQEETAELIEEMAATQEHLAACLGLMSDR